MKSEAGASTEAGGLNDKDDCDSDNMGLDLTANAANNFSVEAIMMKKENLEQIMNSKFFEDMQKKFGFEITPTEIFRQMKALNY